MNRDAGHSDRLDATLGGDERAMRALAARMKADGAARLRLNATVPRRIEAALDAVGSAARRGVALDETALRLRRDGRMALGCARAALDDAGRLPACGGEARAVVLLRELCADGDAALTRERLLDAVIAFDAARPLTMAELWAVPQAARIALSEAFARTAESIADRARQCVAAEAWLRRPGRRIPRRGAAFVEHALRRAAEEVLTAPRLLLERRLTRRNRTAEGEIRQAHAARALDQLRLDNLLAGMRLLDEINWQACFRALSRVDRELRRDPAGVYPRMDDASRAAVRNEVARLALRLDLPELAVASHAVEAARREAGARGTICWWLYDDEGRRRLAARVDQPRARLKRLTPDPTGRATIGAILLLSAVMLVLLARLVRDPWLWPACAPLAWAAANAIVNRLYPRFARPACLLKLEFDRLPDDCRTLVAIPALLSCPARVDEVCDQLEALGSLEADENIEYLLLGDFADAPQAELPGDAAILERARTRVAAMNARAGRAKFAYLHRPRTLLAADGVWMGRDRKRGALSALNRLIAGERGAQAAFSAEGEACERLRGRFAYVVTLDADTRVLPGAVKKLVGAMAHPLNRPDGARGYAVLQPRIETLPSACTNAFMRLFGGVGGVDAYPVSVSNLWQDLTGRGIFAGKGIYDVAAFHARLDGALPEGRILSHDLIEGAIAGAGFIGDVACCDASPSTLAASLRRLNRWTRGDWQLLPILTSRKPLPGGRRLAGADRFRMADNLLRSLRDPATLLLLLSAVWTGNGGALLAALLLAYSEPLLSPPGGDALKWRRATARLAALPAFAACALDAILRTLWRLGVSGKHLLDWVTAADAEARGGADGVRVPCRAAAILALPGALVPGWSPAALALAGLFTLAPGWVRALEEEPADDRAPLEAAQKALFTQLAEETWRFFEASVPADGAGLPPDNVQLDPPVGAARRTSPTNVGLYLMSTLAACRLGFVDAREMRARMARTLDALERMPKWKGHLFNWHDIGDGSALKPRYVSSVDSGNLAAALLLCASAAEVEADSSLSSRMRALARGMDFAALYDGARELFFIGMDVENGRMSASHYDLLASESRILSFTAMLLGQIPTGHWARLGRACARVEGGAAVLSWSGTMFEYLMPLLFMPAPAHTLLGDTVRAVVREQRRHGVPWGVSESGCAALDAGLNYQYRAFGLAALALGGEAEAGVVAPYAAALAAMVDPVRAAENLSAMRRLGWAGEWGMFEAADFHHPDAGGGPALVKSHMAHHQGMILCALCNALTDDSLRADFMRQPAARALAPLLEERPCLAPGSRRRAVPPRDGGQTSCPRYACAARPQARLAETFLLYGGGATALMTADGAAHYARFGVNATRFSGDLIDRRDAACTHLSDEDTGADIVLSGARGEAAFAPGCARVRVAWNGIEAAMRFGVSPEDGTLVRAIELRNDSDRTARVAVTDVAPVALAGDADWRAHAVFRSLFVESSRPAGDALLFRLRPRRREERCPALAHMVRADGWIAFETDYEKLVGREGDPGRDGGIARTLTGALGAVLNPVSALRATLVLPPRGRARLHFALALLGEGESPEAWLTRYRDEAAAQRAIRLAEARAEAMLGFIGLSPTRHALLQRLAALLVDGRLASESKALGGESASSREALWPLGISGDRPILLMKLTGADQQAQVRAAIQAHAFYRAAGLGAELVLLDDGGDGYARPIRDMAAAQLAAANLQPAPGGAWLLDGGMLEDTQRAALEGAAAAIFDGRRDFDAQLRACLEPLNRPERAPARPLATGASTLRPLSGGNGFGAFLPDGGYAVDVRPGLPLPAPWSNLLANDFGGLLLTERGGGFFWRGNSRFGRLTPYGNDARCEGWGLMLYLMSAERSEVLRLLPGDVPEQPFRATFDPAGARYAFETRRLAGEVSFCLRGDRPEVCVDVRLEDRALRGERFILVACVDWLMGGDAADAAWLRCRAADGACLATGLGGGTGYLASTGAFAHAGAPRSAFLGRGDMMRPEGIGDTARGGGWTLETPLRLKRGETARARLALGWSPDAASALARVRALRGDNSPARAQACAAWRAIAEALVIETPDEALNALANGFLIHQVRASRVLGRTGLYQPGGAYGFRDQLQDMLALMHYEPARTREHLLRCAARQFEAGDVMHWWHEPFTGVRTRISDDRLFLPYAAAAYVKLTGDAVVLDEAVPYLEDVPIPEGREDVYRAMRPGGEAGSLHDHCMRAFRSVGIGTHGLAKMGAGDWNDGMNRVGAKGAGESVWLSQFLAACAEDYAGVAPAAGDVVWLRDLAHRMRSAVERHGWDGGWYLRAIADNGAALGGSACPECRIDAISQAWAVLGGLDGARCRMAMDAAWQRLVDEDAGIVRLLAPPFEGRGVDPGYIRGYPAGVRENGAQYTHGALWLLLAWIKMGDAGRAHRALQMLLPYNHADTPEKARNYRVEPYVMAADVYAREGMVGRGGWTWYTGSAAWMHRCILALLGYERRGDAVRLSALLGDWPGVAVTVRFGRSRYRLVCDRAAREVTLDGRRVDDDWIVMADDGRAHEARFPARGEKNEEEELGMRNERQPAGRPETE